VGSHVKSFVDGLRHQSEVHEEESHSVAQVFVASIDPGLILEFGSRCWLAAGGEQRSNHLVAEHHQSDHGTQTFRRRFVSAGVAALLDQLLAAQLLDVVGGLDVGCMRIPLGRCARRPRRPVPKR